MEPSSSTPPSSTKLLITSSNPNSRPKLFPPIAATYSASSSSTATAPPPDKKTRYQPNLSDCHCCGRRTNPSNPKDRLLLLDSVWRIVLLCKKCRKNVRSGQTCPYCFQATENSCDLMTCGMCERKIHRDCVRIYGNCTPWRYLDVDSGGCRVCVDCWVPELLKNSIRVFGESENTGGLREKGEGKDLIENMVNKVKSRGKIRKKDALYLLPGSKTDNSNCGDSTEAVDDAELAIQLHRAINSSPRMLRDKCFVNLSDSEVLSYKRFRLRKKFHEEKKLGETNSCINSAGLNFGMQCYKRDKTRKIWHFLEDSARVSKPRISLPEASVGVNEDQHNVCRFRELLYYQRSRNNKRKIFQVNDLVGGPEGRQTDDAELVFPSGSCASDCDRYYLKYVKRAKGIKPDSCYDRFSTLLNQNKDSVNASNDTETGSKKDGDRYLLKYEKRAAGTKQDSSFHIYNALLSENHDSASALNKYAVGNGLVDPDRYCFKYSKRIQNSRPGPICETKMISGGDSLKGIEPTAAAGLTTNCSAESMTLSDVTLAP